MNETRSQQREERAAAMESPASEMPPRAESGWRSAVDNPWLMLAMLFFVTAALGLPLLWISRGFSTLSKIVLTIVVLLWTALILWLFWLVMVWSYTRITDALAN